MYVYIERVRAYRENTFYLEQKCARDQRAGRVVYVCIYIYIQSI